MSLYDCGLFQSRLPIFGSTTRSAFRKGRRCRLTSTQHWYRDTIWSPITGQDSFGIVFGMVSRPGVVLFALRMACCISSVVALGKGRLAVSLSARLMVMSPVHAAVCSKVSTSSWGFSSVDAHIRFVALRGGVWEGSWLCDSISLLRRHLGCW